MLDLFQTNSCRVSGRLYFHPAWGKLGSVKKAVGFMVGVLLFGSAVFPAQAAFTSFYVFGDSLSTTASNSAAGSLYYGQRYSNGRVWVEVLAQRQGLTFNPAKNTNSFFGNTSSNLFAETGAYTPPGDASNALVVIWVNNADLYYPALDPTPTLAKFTNAINLALTNQYKAITNLYAKGIRTLVMPNVVDISTIPQFNTYASQTNLFHQASTNYNVAFYATLDRARTNCPGLAIFIPDFFSLLTNLIAHPANYGVTNALGNGLSIDALHAQNFGFPVANTNGYGTNYIFWDKTDPTAMVHMWMGNLAQQLISPAQISNITALNGSNQLDLANVPIGQNGLVLGRTNLILGNWTTNVSFISSNATQSVFVTPSGPQWFYRLSFPYSWTWP
jgi:phospholipase/lecithinase/hemolysin